MQWLQHTRTLNTKLSFRWLIELFPGDGDPLLQTHICFRTKMEGRESWAVWCPARQEQVDDIKWIQVGKRNGKSGASCRAVEEKFWGFLFVFVLFFPEKFSWGFSLVATEVPILQDLSWCRKLTRQHGNVALLLHHGDQGFDLCC
jgi:hypothetical protein